MQTRSQVMCEEVGRQRAETVLGRPVEAGEKSKEACLRRRCRYLPRRLAGEAGRGDGGAIVFQRARQIDGMRAVSGSGRLTVGGQC